MNPIGLKPPNKPKITIDLDESVVPFPSRKYRWLVFVEVAYLGRSDGPAVKLFPGDGIDGIFITVPNRDETPCLIIIIDMPWLLLFDYSHDLLIIDMPWQNAVILSDYIINHLPWNIPTCPLNTHDIPTIVPWYSNYIINSHCYPTVIPIFSLQIRSYPSPWFSSWRCNTTKTRLAIFPPVTVFFALLAEVPWVRRNHICSMCYITI